MTKVLITKYMAELGMVSLFYGKGRDVTLCLK
jgi:hypothetical protein